MSYFLFAVVGDQTVGIPDAAPGIVEEGFTLEPLETTGVEKKVKTAKKRKLVVDTDKEFSGEIIRSQFEDFKDTLQPKCFPPPTKKAMMWKEMASCEQLFSKPTSVTYPSLSKAVTRNYNPDLPEGANVDGLDLDDLENTKNLTDENVEQARDQIASVANDDISAADLQLPDNTREQLLEELHFEIEQEERPPLDMPRDQTEEEVNTTRLIPEMPDLMSMEPAEEQQESNELSEEFEARRWTKRTQQVIRVLDRGFKSQESVEFSSLTQRCNRKLAASRFYTCLLLAKEKVITLEQEEAYSDITIMKGAKFTEVS